MNLSDLLMQLRDGTTVPLAAWPAEAPHPVDMGLTVQDGLVRSPDDVDWLDSVALNAALKAGWSAEIVGEIGSTNTAMMDRAAEQSVHGRVLMAEFQSAGRGRRGRHWVSPVARNLALSLGFATNLPPFRLSGASLVVGVAVCSALRSLGLAEAALKWPNDLLAGGHKISGILIEIAAGEPVQLVVGVGINVALGEDAMGRIDQPVTDLRRHGVRENRSRISATVIGEVISALEQFEVEGFSPFTERFDKMHAYHGQKCRVQTGENWVEGIVAGVLPDGRLRLHTEDGEQSFAAGEVSLRQG